MSTKKHGRRRRMSKRKKLALLIVEALAVLIFLSVAVILIVPGAKKSLFRGITSCAVGRSFITCIGKDDYVNNILNKDYDHSKVQLNKGIRKKEGYTNLVLYGIDAGTIDTENRTGNFSNANSDVMIILSINNKTAEVRMASLCRDTFLEMPEGDNGEIIYRKANYAYMAGGPEKSINMINKNFDLDITDYVAVNFNGIAAIIDALGGIDVTISRDELVYINGYMYETMDVTGLESPYLTHSGRNHLDGLQATAYCRIRSVEFKHPDGTVYYDDWGRTARQRYVISLLLEKAKSAGTSELIDVANTIMKNGGESGEKIIETSLPWDDVLDLIPMIADAELTQSQAFPVYGDYDVTSEGMTGYGALIPKDLKHLVTKLHVYLYDKDYTPSSTVVSISDAISAETGIYYVEENESTTDS